MIPILMLVHFGVNILVRYVEFVGLGTIVIIPLFFIAMKGGHLIHLLPVLKEGTPGLTPTRNGSRWKTTGGGRFLKQR